MTEQGTTGSGTQPAPLGRRWKRKMAIFLIVLIGFGAYGLYDAVQAYPKRGERFADWAQWQYLEAARKANDEDFGIFEREASVLSPVEEFERLDERDRKRQNAADSTNAQSGRQLRATMLTTRHAWLEGLGRIGRLTPEHTTIERPNQLLTELRQRWSSAASNPKPLSAFDIPSQWAIMGVCWLIALVMIVHMFRVAARRYSWDASSMTLTLPGGEKITPDDLEEVDKRKWDKFIVFLRIKAEHPELGGQEVRCDLYQRDLLEGWIEEMNERAFGPEEGDDEPAGETSPTETTQEEPGTA
ncbi:MAG: hypothetical protein AAGA55_00850 [Planctomycetota bacterium]